MEGYQRQSETALRHCDEGRLAFRRGGALGELESPAGDWVRTFAIITTDSNELVGQIHDRMPVILHRADYERWIGTDPDPRDLLGPFASEAMRIWPISTRVNKPENDDASILDEVPAQAMEGI
jgi:putative SOS response-associated peptidase YedK